MWILMVTIMYGAYSSTALTAEFQSKEKCELAIQALAKSRDSARKNRRPLFEDAYAFHAVCVEK